MADTVIVCESAHKTLTTLYDLIVDAPHPSNAADCLRISPWSADDLREPLREFTINDLMQLAGLLEGPSAQVGPVRRLDAGIWLEVAPFAPHTDATG